MFLRYFTGEIEKRVNTIGTELPDGIRTERSDVNGYVVEEGLASAVEMAIILGRPLLITGEPGTGKTDLAWVVASELGVKNVLTFETKSTSTAGDMLYVFDSIRRFNAGANSQNKDFIKFGALGEAIIRTRHPDKVSRYLPDQFRHDKPCRSIVLIDEIDKAPRDFPNDILNEIERMYFRIPEIDLEPITFSQEFRPVVFITSNSEKLLPDAFLRRCVFYHIKFPDDTLLKKILIKRLGQYIQNSTTENQFIDDILSFFSKLRNDESIGKKPATAELIDWIVILKTMSKDKVNPMRDNDKAVRLSLAVLLKNSEDIKSAERIYQSWKPSNAS